MRSQALTWTASCASWKRRVLEADALCHLHSADSLARAPCHLSGGPPGLPAGTEQRATQRRAAPARRSGMVGEEIEPPGASGARGESGRMFPF